MTTGQNDAHRNDPHRNDPLHGITLERMVTELHERLGWPELARRLPVRCFQFQPSVKSSLAFLRRTPWARARLEDLYRESLGLAPAPERRQ